MANRRVSFRKILQTLVTLIALSGAALALISAGQRQAVRHIQALDIVVESPAGVRFLDQASVRKMLFNNRHVAPGKLILGGINERNMESILRSNPWVKAAQVYTDARQVLHVYVRQRVPLVRVFEMDGNSYYLDGSLQSMPLSSYYTHYVPIITGVQRLGNDSISQAVKGQIVGLVRCIRKDSFWRAQVSQIDMRPDGGFELIPVLGKQRIILGDTMQMQDKLNRLLAFYRQVQNKVGWNHYTTLDLRFANQVVASPKLSWKIPVDHALSNINWLQAIMENAPKQDLPGGDGAVYSDSDSQQSTPVTDNPTPDKR
ncbi:MAG: hypothetical protein JST06_00965 [Bacteroidetes bacterium]|nr:hypothetical protein [Bacteroidota bacterium]MBS1630166.1 hypothetical protein [Bacteroidota bacterium]